MAAYGIEDHAVHEMTRAGLAVLVALGSSVTLLWWAFLIWLALAFLPPACAAPCICAECVCAVSALALARAAGRANELERIACGTWR